MSRFPRKCPKCRERSVEVVTESYSATIEHDGRSYDITIPDLRLLKCQNQQCGNRILDDDADERVSAALRAAAGLQSPEVIRDRRLALGLTQRQLADRLCVAEATLSRWETGAQIPQRHSSLILEAFFDVPEFRAYLERRLTGEAVVVPEPKVA